jgi:hypothetical protein
VRFNGSFEMTMGLAAMLFNPSVIAIFSSSRHPEFISGSI